MHQNYRVKVKVEAELDRPYQEFTVPVHTANPALVEWLACQCVKDRLWHSPPSDSSIIVVSIEHVRP